MEEVDTDPITVQLIKPGIKLKIKMTDDIRAANGRHLVKMRA